MGRENLSLYLDGIWENVFSNLLLCIIFTFMIHELHIAIPPWPGREETQELYVWFALLLRKIVCLQKSLNCFLLSVKHLTSLLPLWALQSRIVWLFTTALQVSFSFKWGFRLRIPLLCFKTPFLHLWTQGMPDQESRKPEEPLLSVTFGW